jgi:hypothetical protein
MGRLTLNILLSFAQFEREVIGERIRDKFAASRRRGIWMGGWTPLGYDIKDRKLIINEPEAHLVRSIFTRFARGTPASQLIEMLAKQGALNKQGKPIDKGYFEQNLWDQVHGLISESPHKCSTPKGAHASHPERSDLRPDGRGHDPSPREKERKALSLLHLNGRHQEWGPCLPNPASAGGTDRSGCDRADQNHGSEPRNHRRHLAGSEKINQKPDRTSGRR